MPTGFRGDSLHDQPRQSNMEKLTLSILTMALSLTIESGTTSADEISRLDYAQPLEPKIKEIQVENVRALTGNDSPTEMKSLDVCGTDLGTMTEIGHRIFFAFGDTFGYDGDICRGIGGPNWRSKVFGIVITRSLFTPTTWAKLGNRVT